MGATGQLLKVGRYGIQIQERGGGDPVLFLHGFDGAPSMDSPFIAALAASRRVIVPSHPGFDGSTDDIAIHDMHNVAVFYQELVEVLGLSSCDVIGHSLGGMFAAEFAAISGGLVRRLVLAAPLGLWLDDAPVPDFIPSGGNALMRMLWADPSTATPPPSSTATPEEAEETVAHTANLAAATNYLWPLPDRGLKHRLHRVKAPTLLLWGDADAIVGRPYRDEFAARIPGVRVEGIAGAGHLLFDEQPVLCAEAVASFLS